MSLGHLDPTVRPGIDMRTRLTDSGPPRPSFAPSIASKPAQLAAPAEELGLPGSTISAYNRPVRRGFCVCPLPHMPTHPSTQPLYKDRNSLQHPRVGRSCDTFQIVYIKDSPRAESCHWCRVCHPSFDHFISSGYLTTLLVV